MTADTFSTGPAGVYAQINHDGQHVTVVKLQEATLPAHGALESQLRAALGLAPEALLLVLPTEGEPLLGQGPPEQVYNNFLSTNTAAVVEQRWLPLEQR